MQDFLSLYINFLFFIMQTLVIFAKNEVMTTILVTGASGFVGSRFVRRWAGEYTILAPTHAELDITDSASVESYFAFHHPQVVLHLAALSNTAYCEQNPDESYRVNVLGTQNLARSASARGIKFVFFSSDQIYNGNHESGLLSEDVPVAPENVYGRHKLLAEELLFELAPDAVALRATWMYDDDDEGLPVHPNFVMNFKKALREGSPIAFPVREYRGITWVKEVVEFLPRTFSLQGGVYNFGAQNRLNTYETACCYFEMLSCGLRCDDIVIADADRYPTHERNISISNEKIFSASNGAVFFNDTLDGLRIFVECHLASHCV